MPDRVATVIAFWLFLNSVKENLPLYAPHKKLPSILATHCSRIVMDGAKISAFPFILWISSIPNVSFPGTRCRDNMYFSI